MENNRNSYILVEKFEGKLPNEGCGLLRENIIEMDRRDMVICARVTWLSDRRGAFVIIIVSL
jgi:hypothetical protein